MTDNEINETVGRKLGWKKDAKNWWFKPTPGQTHDFVLVGFVPDYCHSIEAAWEVVNNWFSTEIRFRTFELLKNNGSQWYAQFRQENDDKIYDSVGSLPSMAICLAFLKLPILND